MQFTIFSILSIATAVFAHQGAPMPAAPPTSISSDSGSCREYTYCMSPSSTTGLLNVFGTDQDVCDSIGGDQYCCSQELSTGSLIAINTLNNLCGLNII